MRVLIDGDGCPVVALTVRLCREAGVPCTIVCDTCHTFSSDYASVVVCDRGADSADYRIVSLAQKGDLCITQDYGLAAMCLARGASAIDQNGMRYTADNSGGLLEARAFSARVRRGGGRLKGPKKREAAQNDAFAAVLRRILKEAAAHAGGNS